MAAARGRAGGHGTSRGVTTTIAADAGDAAAGFDFGDAARMAAEFAPILGGAPAGQRGHKAARRARARTRSRVTACTHVCSLLLPCLAFCFVFFFFCESSLLRTNHSFFLQR